jgi:hypothetical protein
MNDSCLIAALIAVILFHFYVVIGNALAFFILPFCQPWFVALPCCSLILTLSFGRPGDCPLTRFENYLRGKLGISPIKGFIKHYFLSWKKK